MSGWCWAHDARHAVGQTPLSASHISCEASCQPRILRTAKLGGYLQSTMRPHGRLSPDALLWTVPSSSLETQILFDSDVS